MNEQRPQVIVIKQQSNGCLVTALVFLLFGWIGLAVMAAWKLTKLAWKLCVAYPVKWTVALTKWSVNVAAPWTVKASKQFHARYGWRGWAILGAGVVVLAIIGNLTSH